MDINANTTAAKGVKTLLWVVVANIVIYVLTVVISKPELFNPLVVGGANVILVLAKNFVDPTIRNI